MSLKAVLFDFNGIIIDDEAIHQDAIAQILLEENLRPDVRQYWQLCLGRSDRACLNNLFSQRGRVLTEEALQQLIERKAKLYRQKLEATHPLPLYPDLNDLMFKIRAAQLSLAIVSGALASEIEWVLEQTQLRQYFSVIVAGDDLQASKPEPDGYLLAVEQLNQANPKLNLQPSQCLAIEDSFAGIESAKRAGIPVVGVAHTYPFHMLQRQANWTVDYLLDIELDRIQETYATVAAR